MSVRLQFAAENGVLLLSESVTIANYVVLVNETCQCKWCIIGY